MREERGYFKVTENTKALARLGKSDVMERNASLVPCKVKISKTNRPFLSNYDDINRKTAPFNELISPDAPRVVRYQ